MSETKKQYIVDVVQGTTGIVDGSIGDGSGNPVASQVIYELASHLQYMASRAASAEAAAKLKPGFLCYSRMGGNVRWVRVDSIDQQQVLVKDSDKQGVVDPAAEAYLFWDAQLLTLAKHQPVSNAVATA